MKKLLLVLALIAFLATPAFAVNTWKGKGTPWISVTLDGSTAADLCAYLGVDSVALWGITQGKLTSGELTVTDGNGGSNIYGPFVDVTGSGLHEYYNGWSCKPYIAGGAGTAAITVTFHVVYVTK